MDPFVGEIRIFTGNFAPQGWFLCQGQMLQISQYSALFSILGTSYGGDGVSTFALPNLQGRCAVGVGASQAGSHYTLGQVGGLEQSTIPSANNLPPHTHAATTAAHNHSVTVPAHNHGFTVPAHTHPYTLGCDGSSALEPSPSGAYPANSGTSAYSNSSPDKMAAQTTSASDGTTPGTTANSAAVPGTSGDATVTVAVQSTGAGASFPTMSPYLSINYIIAWNGVYPSRP